jgi:hypothetical protein
MGRRARASIAAEYHLNALVNNEYINIGIEVCLDFDWFVECYLLANLNYPGGFKCSGANIGRLVGFL